jgi:protein-L-isoaspartate(D-aspartate) O-methyltransferase
MPERSLEETNRRALVTTVEHRIGPVAAPYREALLGVDRARFVRPCDRARAWNDEPLPLDTPHGEQVATVSAPHIYVLAFQALGLSPGDRYLELGSGSGYGAALGAWVVGSAGRVTTVETDPHLARIALHTTALLPNVRVLHDDGLARADLVANHDKTWLTFSVDAVPRAMLEALGERAILVAPVGPIADQRMLRWERRDGALVESDLGAVRFVQARPLVTG